MNKQGMMYTLTLSLFALALFGLTVAYLQQAQQASARYTELNLAAKIYDVDTSVEQVFALMFSQKGAFFVQEENNYLLILESLPANFVPMDTLAGQFVVGVEDDFPTFRVNLSGFVNNHSFRERPLNITYFHLSNRSIVFFFPTSVQAGNFSLSFDYNITSCTTGLQQGGNFMLAMAGLSPGVDCTVSGSQAQSGVVRMATGEGQATIELLPTDVGFQVTISSNVTAQSRVVLNYGSSGHIEIPIVLTVNDSDIYRTHKVRLPSLS